MRRWIVATLVAVMLVLLAAAVVHGYQADQRQIPMFAGTGIAGKVDVIGALPLYLTIQDVASRSASKVAVNRDGSFAARLQPGRYRVTLPGRPQSATVDVSSAECDELIFDFRLPGIALVVAGEGWPLPRAIGA